MLAAQRWAEERLHEMEINPTELEKTIIVVSKQCAYFAAHTCGVIPGVTPYDAEPLAMDIITLVQTRLRASRVLYLVPEGK